MRRFLKVVLIGGVGTLSACGGGGKDADDSAAQQAAAAANFRDTAGLTVSKINSLISGSAFASVAGIDEFSCGSKSGMQNCYVVPYCFPVGSGVGAKYAFEVTNVVIQSVRVDYSNTECTGEPIGLSEVAYSKYEVLSFSPLSDGSVDVSARAIAYEDDQSRSEYDVLPVVGSVYVERMGMIADTVYGGIRFTSSTGAESWSGWPLSIHYGELQNEGFLDSGGGPRVIE